MAKRNRRAIVIQALKGGAGKSTIARLLIDLGRARGRSVSAHDLDTGSGSLVLLYNDQDPIKGVIAESLDDRKSTRWFDALAGPADDVIYDVPGGRSKDFIKAFGGVRSMIDEVENNGRELVIVTPITHKKDSIPSIQDAWDRWPQAKHVIIKNGFFGEHPVDDFPIFEGFLDDNGAKQYGKYREQADANGSHVIYVPRLDSYADSLADSGNLTFAKAADRSDSGSLPSLMAKRVWGWLRDVSDAISGTPIDMPEPQETPSRQKTPRETETVAS